MLEDRKPFLADGSVEVVRANLEGAKYTLAVPSYVAEAGVRSFEDLARFGDRFHRKIFAIEPGNNGNRMIASIIAANRFGLGEWTMVESSEQGMLSEVDRAIHKSDWIVFLGWSPHPMNLKYRMQYLSGGDDTFGANYGGATIYTDVRSGYLAECPNVGTLLKNLKFTPDIESRMMSLILDERLEGRTAATNFLKAHLSLLDGWLDGVTTFNGRPGSDAVRREITASSFGHLTDRLQSADQWLVGHKIPLGQWLSGLVQYATDHAQGFFDLISDTLGRMITVLTALLMRVPALILIAAVALCAYWLQRKVSLALFILGALLLIDNLGLWEATVQTLSLVLFSTVVCMLFGIPIGIAAAHRPLLYRVLHPVLDLMQTIPTFVYLIPTLVLFGLGVVPGLDLDGHFRHPGADPAHASRHLIGAEPAARGRRGFRRDAAPAPRQDRAAVRAAHHHGGHHAEHHAEPVHGGHRSAGRRRRARQAGGARAQFRQHRHGLRIGTGDRHSRHRARPHLQAQRPATRRDRVAAAR